MRHSNHGLLRRIEWTIIAKIFWMPVKLVADPDSGRSIAHAMRPTILGRGLSELDLRQ